MAGAELRVELGFPGQGELAAGGRQAPGADDDPHVVQGRARPEDRRQQVGRQLGVQSDAGLSQPGQPGLGCLDVKELKLAGIVWGQRGYYALVEAPNGAGYVLRVNDTVGEGARVTKIASDIVAFEVKGGPGPQAQPARVVELRLRKEE